MKNEEGTIIPIFFECSSCKRNFISNSPFWADTEKHICVCCECFGFDTSIITCKRANCKYHRYLDRDYIDDMEILPTPEANENKSEQEYNYDEKLNKCYCCNKELYIDFIFINAKFSLFDNGKFEESESKSKLKAKICGKCFDSISKKLRLKFI